jgi:hypothetical protein
MRWAAHFLEVAAASRDRLASRIDLSFGCGGNDLRIFRDDTQQHTRCCVRLGFVLLPLCSEGRFSMLAKLALGQFLVRCGPQAASNCWAFLAPTISELHRAQVKSPTALHSGGRSRAEERALHSRLTRRARCDPPLPSLHFLASGSPPERAQTSTGLRRRGSDSDPPMSSQPKPSRGGRPDLSRELQRLRGQDHTDQLGRSVDVIGFDASRATRGSDLGADFSGRQR